MAKLLVKVTTKTKFNCFIKIQTGDSNNGPQIENCTAPEAYLLEQILGKTISYTNF